MSKIIVLQNQKEQMMGFLMFSGQASPFTDHDWQGKCLFAGSPMEANATTDPVIDFLKPYKNKPFTATLVHSDKLITISVSGLLTATLNPQWQGHWQADNNPEISGKCHVPSIPQVTQH